MRSKAKSKVKDGLVDFDLLPWAPLGTTFSYVPCIYFVCDAEGSVHYIGQTYDGTEYLEACDLKDILSELADPKVYYLFLKKTSSLESTYRELLAHYDPPFNKTLALWEEEDEGKFAVAFTKETCEAIRKLAEQFDTKDLSQYLRIYSQLLLDEINGFGEAIDLGSLAEELELTQLEVLESLEYLEDVGLVRSLPAKGQHRRFIRGAVGSYLVPKSTEDHDHES